MLTSFKRQKPYHSLLLSLLGLVFFFPVWFKASSPVLMNEDGVLYKMLYVNLHAWGIDMRWLIVLFLIGTGIYINHIVVKHKMFPHSNGLAGLCWILITSFFASKFQFLSVWFVMAIMMLLFAKILMLHGNQKIKSELFNIGFLYSIAVLVYSPAIFFAFFIGMMLLLIRPVYLHEWLLVAIGAITPYYLMASFLFLNDQPLSSVLPVLTMHAFSLKSDPLIFTASILLALLPAMIGFWHIQTNMRKLLVHSRESWSAFYLFLFCGLLILFFSASSDLTLFLFLLFPLSVITAGFFFYLKNRYLTGFVFLIWLSWSLWNAFSSV